MHSLWRIQLCCLCVIVPVIELNKPNVHIGRTLSFYGGTRLSGPAVQIQTAVKVEDGDGCDVNTQMVVKSPHADVQMAP